MKYIVVVASLEDELQEGESIRQGMVVSQNHHRLGLVLRRQHIRVVLHQRVLDDVGEQIDLPKRSVHLQRNLHSHQNGKRDTYTFTCSWKKIFTSL